MSSSPLPPLRIGLTGGIGSGKSTVAGMLAQHGAEVIDTDAIAHALTAPDGAAIAPIRECFGPASIAADGSLDRTAMRRLAFADPIGRQRLEAILHPMIGAAAERQAAAASGAPAHVFDVPLLVESGRWRDRVDRVLVVDADAATQTARVVRRSGWSVATVQSVIAVQASRDARRTVADAVIDNGASVDLTALSVAVDAVWQRWVALR